VPERRWVQRWRVGAAGHAGERRSGLGLGLGASIASAKEMAGLRVLTEGVGWSETWRRRAGGEDWRRCWAELAETGAGGVRRAPEFLGLTRWRPAETFQGQRDTIATGGEEKLNGGAFSPPSVAEGIAARGRPGVGVEGAGDFTGPWRSFCAGRGGAEGNGAAGARRRRGSARRSCASWRS